MQPVQQYAPPQAGQMAPVFVEVTVPSGEAGPGFVDLIGRPVAMVVRQAGLSPAFKGDTRADAQGNIPTVWFDLYVGGEGQIVYGAAPKADPPRPLPTHTVSAPCVFRNQMSSNELIYRALAPNAGQPSFITGIVGKIGRAYCLNAFDAGNAALAQQLHAQVTALVTGTLPEPVPQPTGYAPQPQQPVAAPVQQYAPQPAPAVQPNYMTAQQSYAQVPQPVQQPVAAPAEVLPPGMTAEFWATLSEPQRQMMRAQAQAQAPGAVATPPNPY